jgi:ATP-dependent Clp protease ATP-binding subunit ClpA
MFERFTEAARRVIFFARYEASQYGSTTIETEHFLLGLFREDTTFRQLLPDSAHKMSIREQINRRVETRPKVSTSSDLPLSDECKRILAHSAKEAESLKHSRIGPVHLLLGILCEENCAAAKVLKALGLELDATREKVSQYPATLESSQAGTQGHSLKGPQIPHTPLPAAGIVPDAETALMIAQAVWRARLEAPLEGATALNAVLMHGVWLVIGTHTVNNAAVVLTAFIQKEDGKILRIHQDSAAS